MPIFAMLRRSFTREDAEDLIERATKWFKENPRRRVCRTELSSIRRNHIREDTEKLIYEAPEIDPRKIFGLKEVAKGDQEGVQEGVQESNQRGDAG